MQKHYEAFLGLHRVPDSVTHRSNYLKALYPALRSRRADGHVVPCFGRQVIKTVVTTNFGEPFPAFVGFHPVTQETAWVFDASDRSRDAATLKTLQTTIARAASFSATASKKLENRTTAAQQRFERMQQQPDDSFFVATGLTPNDIASSSAAQSS
ncbi:MAG: hypothetical protein JWQ11_1598 [Rhizobacter sp.]|nr:hypothetical protein [Rhizobacter sp.]